MPSLKLLIFVVLLGSLTAFAQVNERGAVSLPKPEPVAETKLLMQGFAMPNFSGLRRNLAKKPSEAEAWTFARGQSLMIAEAGNLLMLRPPKEKAKGELWIQRAGELRTAAVKVSKAAESKDYVSTRAALAEVANACNRCHSAFQVPTRIDPSEPSQE